MQIDTTAVIEQTENKRKAQQRFLWRADEILFPSSRFRNPGIFYSAGSNH